MTALITTSVRDVNRATLFTTLLATRRSKGALSTDLGVDVNVKLVDRGTIREALGVGRRWVDVKNMGLLDNA